MPDLRPYGSDNTLSREQFLRNGGMLGAGLIGAVGLGGSLGAYPALAAGDTGLVRRIDDLYPAWQLQFNNGDVEGLLALYEKGATFVTPTGQLVHGSGIAAQYEALIALRPHIDIFERHHVVSGAIALTSNRWRMTTNPPGGKPGKLHGGGIEVARRGTDGGWRFVIDDASRSASPPA